MGLGFGVLGFRFLGSFKGSTRVQGLVFRVVWGVPLRAPFNGSIKGSIRVYMVYNAGKANRGMLAHVRPCEAPNTEANPNPSCV